MIISNVFACAAISCLSFAAANSKAHTPLSAEQQALIGGPGYFGSHLRPEV